MKQERLLQLLAESERLEKESIYDREEIGFMPNALSQTFLPYKNPKCEVANGCYGFERKNGNSQFLITTPSVVGGLPYGNIPRLLIAWLTTEARRTGKRDVVLGNSMTDFLRCLGISASGGVNGTIPRVKTQVQRTFASSITYTKMSKELGLFTHDNMSITSKVNLWWEPGNPDDLKKWRGEVRLGENFFETIMERPVPVDMGALRALKHSAMALDIYMFLTYRFSYIKKPTVIPWEDLQMQFGTTNSSIRSFRQKFKKQLQLVLAVYKDARVDVLGAIGIMLKPSSTHVPKLFVVESSFAEPL